MQLIGKPTNQQTNKPAGAEYSYRNLDVWVRSQELAVKVIKFARRLPRDPGMAVIVRQIVGSAGSVGANVAEGHGRFSRAAYGNHLSIAKGSASEVGSWLDLLKRLEEIDARVEAELQAEIDSLIRLLKYKINGLAAADRAAKSPKGRATKPAYRTKD